MNTGVSTNSSALQAVFSTSAYGTWAGDYPVTNLSDLRAISKVARVTPDGSGRVSFNFILPAAVPLQFFAPVRHGLPDGSSFELWLFSDNNPDPVGNAGAIVSHTATTEIWPSSSAPVSGYPSTRPILLSAPVSARSGHVYFTSAGAAAIDMGGFEVSQFWSWAGLAPGKEGGFISSPRKTNLIGGAAIVEDAWMPRKLNGEISFLALATAATTGIDFQKDTGLGKPFVYVQDADDATSWARQCWLARNVDVPPSVGRLYRHDAFQFRFREHWR